MSSRDEEAALTPATRHEIIERDQVCRMCGAWAQVQHVHHILYRSQGGPDSHENLVLLDLGCHDRVHRNKRLWQPILQQVAITPGVNAVQLLRWYEKRKGMP